MLTDDLNRFASHNQLEASGEFPGSRIYKERAGAFQMSVAYGMGPFGTVVSIFPLNGRNPEAFSRKLEGFLSTQVAGRWQVRRCEDIPGFTMPTLFRG